MKVDFNQKIELKSEYWTHSCGDGCCFVDGDDLQVNGELIFSDAGEFPAHTAKALLEHLGFTNVEVV